MNPIYASRRRNNIIIKFLCLGAALEDDPRLVDWRAGLDEPLAT